jgi:hypothetical protein
VPVVLAVTGSAVLAQAAQGRVSQEVVVSAVLVPVVLAVAGNAVLVPAALVVVDNAVLVLAVLENNTTKEELRKVHL